MLDYLFRVIRAGRCALDPHDQSSRHSMPRKSGFRRVRLLPRHELHEGELRDCRLMGVDA
jgi:aminoglycoside 6'-N-acetyltransferase